MSPSLNQYSYPNADNGALFLAHNSRRCLHCSSPRSLDECRSHCLYHRFNTKHWQICMDTVDIFGARCHPLRSSNHRGWNRRIPIFHSIRHLEPIIQPRDYTFNNHKPAHEHCNQGTYGNRYGNCTSNHSDNDQLSEFGKPNSKSHVQRDHSLSNHSCRHHLDPERECDAPYWTNSSSPNHCKHGRSSAQFHPFARDEDYDCAENSPSL